MTASRFMLPLAFAVCLAAAPAQAAPDRQAGQAGASRTDADSVSQGKATRRATRRPHRAAQRRHAEPASRAGFETVRFPDCLFVFCHGRPLLIGVAF